MREETSLATRQIVKKDRGRIVKRGEEKEEVASKKRNGIRGREVDLWRHQYTTHSNKDRQRKTLTYQQTYLREEPRKWQ